MVDAELHDGGSTSFTLVFLPIASGAQGGVTHVRNINRRGYEFESGKAAIS